LIRSGGFIAAEKLFILAFEGEQTEKQYFLGLRNSDLFNDAGLIEIINLPRPKKVGTDPVILHFKDPAEITQDEFDGIFRNEKVGSKRYVSIFIGDIFPLILTANLI